MPEKNKLKNIRMHFNSASTGGVSEYSQSPETLETDLKSEMFNFASAVKGIRTGRLGTDESGNEIKLPAREITFEQATREYFGCSKKDFLVSLGVNTNSDSLKSAAKKLGCESSEFNESYFKKMMHDHAVYNGTTHSTNDFRDFRFVIPELFLDLVRTNYLHEARYPNWVAQTVFVGSSKRIVAGRLINDTPKFAEIEEGGDIPLDSVSVAQKYVDTKKFGVGVKLTRELLEETVIDLLALTLQGATHSLNIGEDNRCLDVIVNGEQTDGSESAPIVGVKTAGALEEEDFDNVINRMDWLRNKPDRTILSSDDAKSDLNEGKPERDRLTIAKYTEMPADIWSLPADTIVMIDSKTAIVRLQYGSFMVEENYEEKNQTNKIYFSFRSCFMVLKRDARVLMDKSQTFAALPFPDYMDIDKFIKDGAFGTF